MSVSKEVILITAGDPASISTEITIRAIETKKINRNIKPIVITDINLVQEYKILINSSIKINEIKDKIKFSDYKNNHLNIIPIKLNNKIEYGKPDVNNQSFIKLSIIKTIEIYKNSIASAIVTNPY